MLLRPDGEVPHLQSGLEGEDADLIFEPGLALAGELALSVPEGENLDHAGATFNSSIVVVLAPNSTSDQRSAQASPLLTSVPVTTRTTRGYSSAHARSSPSLRDACSPGAAAGVFAAR